MWNCRTGWALLTLGGIVVCMTGCSGAIGTPEANVPRMHPLQEDEPLRLRIRGTDDRGRRANEVFINGRWVPILNDPLFDQWLAYQVSRYETFYQQTGTPKAFLQDRGTCRAVFRTQVVLEVVGDGHAMSAVNSVTRKLREAGFATQPQIVSAEAAVPAN